MKTMLSNKIHKFLLLVVLACILSACNATPQNMESAPNSISESSTPENGSSTPATSSDKETPLEDEFAGYKLVSPPDGIIYTGGALIDDGFYELVFAKDVISGARNIVYTDFSTLHRIYLSSDVNSDHQSENDTSYIPAAVGGAGIITDGEYIYIIKKGSILLQDSYGEAAWPCLYRSNLDGSDRITIDLSPDQTINGTSGIFSDGDSLILLIDVVNEDASPHQELIRADFSSKKLTTLVDFSDVGLATQNLALVSSFGGKFVLSSLDFDDENGLIQTLYTLDPSKETIEPLVTFIPEKQYAFFQNGIIYYLDTDEQTLYSLDPLTMEKKIVLQKVAPPDITFDSIQIGFAAPTPYMAFRFNRDDSGSNYYWNSETGEWKKEQLMDGDREVHIYGIWKDYFLVKLQDKMVSYQDFTPEGQSYTNEMAVAEYALINQDDYWNGIPKYIHFKDDVYGD